MAAIAHVKGVPEVMDALRAIQDVPGVVQRRALRNMAKEVGKQAQALAPDDPTSRDKRSEYRKLRESLTVRKRKSFYVIRFAAKHAAAQHERMEWQHPGGQAKFLEQPFMAARSDFITRMGAEVQKELAREAKMAARRAKVKA